MHNILVLLARIAGVTLILKLDRALVCYLLEFSFSGINYYFTTGHFFYALLSWALKRLMHRILDLESETR